MSGTAADALRRRCQGALGDAALHLDGDGFAGPLGRGARTDGNIPCPDAGILGLPCSGLLWFHWERLVGVISDQRWYWKAAGESAGSI